jgi:hypothetical protein
MKNKERRVRIFLLVTAVIAVGFQAGGQSGSSTGGDQFKAVSPLGCRISSWTPEVYGFYGDPGKVMDKLAGFDMKLAERRIYMFMVEGGDSGELALFERPLKGGDSWTVWRWKGKRSDATKLREKELNEILSIHGEDCVGQATKKLVESWHAVRQETKDPPTTAFTAFGNVVTHYPKSSYVLVTVFLLC